LTDRDSRSGATCQEQLRIRCVCIRCTAQVSR
jgi:hypothetical protein